jgi:hypothetical protein
MIGQHICGIFLFKCTVKVCTLKDVLTWKNL